MQDLFIYWLIHMVLEVCSALHLSGTVSHMLRSPASTAAPALCEHVLQRLNLAACLPAWGQLGSRALWSEAPLGSPD